MFGFSNCEANGNLAPGTCGKCYGYGRVIRTVQEESQNRDFRETISSDEIRCDRCGGRGKLGAAAHASRL